MTQVVSKIDRLSLEGRRRHMNCLVALAAIFGGLQGCTRERENLRPDLISDEDTALRHQFRGLRGGELFVDALVETNRSVIYKPDGNLFAGLFGVYSPTKSVRTGYFGDEKAANLFSVPKTLRMVRYPAEAEINVDWKGRNIREAGMFLGNPVVDVTVPVASRIPIEALDRVRKYNGSLTLKLRMTPDTLLIGWEVRNGQNYRYKVDKNGLEFVTDEDVMKGGDFCERQVRDTPVNGELKLVEIKGWYIDPKSGQKIATDF